MALILVLVGAGFTFVPAKAGLLLTMGAAGSFFRRLRGSEALADVDVEGEMYRWTAAELAEVGSFVAATADGFPTPVGAEEFQKLLQVGKERLA